MNKDSLWVLASCFTLASVAGLAAYLHSGKPLSWVKVVSAMLYSGVTGLLIGLMWYNYFEGQKNLYFLISVSGLAGIGGVNLLDFILHMITGGGLQVTLKTSKDSEKE